MTTELTQPDTRSRLLWWEGVGSPGIVGYLLSDVAAVAALAVMLPLTDSTVHDLGDYVPVMLIVAFYAMFFSIPLALVGIPIVHFCCLRVRSQTVHVLAAGVVGFAVVAIPMGLSSPDEGFPVEGFLLGLATATGRAAVIPLARRRQS